MNIRVLIVVVVALLFAAAPFQASFAKLYKWVDDNGNVTYSQLKPPDRKADTLELRGIDSPRGAETSTDQEAKDKDGAKPPAGEPANAPKQASAGDSHSERIKQNCETSQQNLRLLESAPRLSAQDDKGNSYILTAEQVDARKAQARDHIKLYCR